MKSICFYSGYTGDSFNGINYQNKNIYGSEKNLIHLCKYLSKYYKIYILVWNLKSKNEEIIHDNIYYIDCHNYDIIPSIDILIINRYLNFFIHFMNKAKKTFIWVQDLIGHTGYQGIHFDKQGKNFLINIDPIIDKYIVLSNFHKEYFNAFYENKIPQHKIEIIGNGLLKNKPIDLNKINQKRIKKRFMFCSEPVRGLTFFLDFIEELQKEDAEISACIFRSNNYTAQILEKIKKIKNITVYNTSNQQILFDEFLKSEFLLYTCNFLETFCNIALEAQYHGCICIYNQYGALKETIQNRGLILEGHPTDNNFIEKNTLKVKSFINNEQEKNRLQHDGYNYANKQYYKHVSEKWKELIEEL
jgi:hypothetical protein